MHRFKHGVCFAHVCAGNNAESADKAARALSFALYRVWVEPEQPVR